MSFIKQALVQDGVVISIIEQEESIAAINTFPDGIEAVTITDLEIDLGWEYDGITFSKPTSLLETEIRTERDIILAKVVDPLVTNPLRWAELTEAKQAEWTQYRRDLLDITDQAGFPNEVTWPTKPEGAN